jgi:myo-inositol 2-dehydrogenase/D-chiro-inositol 1-dehydrogenase
MPLSSDSLDRPVRLALVGAGGHGATHQAAIEATDAVRLAAVYDVDASAMQDAAARFGCDAAASYEAVLAREDLDAVVLATPNPLHRPQATAALEAGLDVLLEKPIAATLEDGRAIAEAAQRAGRVLMVGHNMRRSRAARQVRTLLDEGRLGTPVSMEIHFSTPSGRGLSGDTWRLGPEQEAALPILQLGIHGIDLVHYFFGAVDEVYASARSVGTPEPARDAIAATFRTAGGLHGTLVSNYCTQVTFAYRIAGTKASVESRAHTLWVRDVDDADVHGEGPATTHDFTDHRTESYHRQMAAFARAVRTRSAPETGAPEALQALAVTEAIGRSGRRGAPEAVEPAGRSAGA